MAMSFLRQRGGVSDDHRKEDVGPENDKEREKMPGLWEFLTTAIWPTGETRETGTILVFCEDAKVKLCLSERDSQHVAFLSADTLQEALAKADKGIREDTLDWRLSKAGKTTRIKSR